MTDEPESQAALAGHTGLRALLSGHGNRLRTTLHLCARLLRATDARTGGTHYYLDMTALGRQEDWEEPKGRSTGAPRADQVGAGRT